MSPAEHNDLYLDLFVDHAIPPEPRIATRLRERAKRELGAINSRLNELPRASRDPSVARERKSLTDRFTDNLAVYESWIARVRASRKRYDAWRPRHEDWIKLVMIMAARQGRVGFKFEMPKSKPQAERAFYLDNLLANAERIEAETGQSAKAVLSDAVKRTNLLIAEGHLDDPADPDKNVRGWELATLEERLSKRKNGKLPEVGLPPSIRGPLEAVEHFRSLLAAGFQISDWGDFDVLFGPDAICEELEGRTRDDLRHRPIASFEHS